jgi:methyltransferase
VPDGFGVTFLVLFYVVVERLAELVISSRNTRRLRARGSHEVGASHYPFMVAMHVAWLVAIMLWVAIMSPAINMVFLLIYALIQIPRFWVMVSLGEYWTTRIISVPNAPLVRRGPYKFARHPNYIVVVLEIAALPLVFGAWHIAAIFSVLNAVMLWVRIRCENGTLILRGDAS